MRLIPFMLMAALLRAIASSRCSSSSCGSAAATCRGRPLKALLAKHHPDKSTGSTEAKIELDEVRDELQELVGSHYTDRTKAAARRAP